MPAILDFTANLSELRCEAEEMLQGSAVRSAANGSPADLPNTTDRLVHELRVHQLELEMQNEHLLRVQQEIELQRDRYVDLFDYAPVGFVTFNADGRIVEANLTLTLLLGESQAQLVHQAFARYVSTEDSPKWTKCFRHLLRDGYRQTCHLKIQPQDGTTLFARLYLTRVTTHGQVSVRAAVMDISESEYGEPDSLINVPSNA